MNSKMMITASLTSAVLIVAACNNSGGNTSASTDTSSGSSQVASNQGTDPKGIGQYKDVQLTHPLDEKMIATGTNVYQVKCASCHKLTDEKLVGPGWKGVTDRRTPEWIMNFVTNTDEMISKDTAAQKMLEVCLVRMPNQSLADADARGVLEFMRKNDGKQ
jgi:cytochrome c2